MRVPRHTSKEIDRLRFAMMQSREKAGKSQNDMAKILGVHKNTVSNWENGYSVPDYLDVITWFDALGFPISNEYILDINPNKANIIPYDANEKPIRINNQLYIRLTTYLLRLFVWKEKKK